MPFAKVNNQEIYYEDSGGDGPAVVFMHGFLFDQAMFDPQVKAVSPQYRCVRFDARGFGQTQWDGNSFSLYDTAADCVGLMDHLGIQKATIAGMSQGGYAALRVAVKYPERVQALVFISTYNGMDTEDVKAVYRSMRDTWQNKGPGPVVDILLNLFIGTEEQASDMRAVWRPKWEARTSNDIVHTMNNLIDREEVTDEQVKQISVPVMVIHGEADQGIPMALGENLFQSMPNGKKMLTVPEATHGVSLTHADAVNSELKAFLDEYAAS